MGSVFFVFNVLKMCKKSEFQVNNTYGSLSAKGNRLEGWGKVPHPKNSFWGHFLRGVHFPSCCDRSTRLL